jgi:hypothetical protein
MERLVRDFNSSYEEVFGVGGTKYIAGAIPEPQAAFFISMLCE